MGGNFIACKVQLVAILTILGGAHSQTCNSTQCNIGEFNLPSNIGRSRADPCFDVGERVNFSCPAGHDLAGPPYNQCTEDGNWQFGTSPFCEDVSPCALEDIENGMVSPETSVEVYETVKYSCNAGYVISNGKPIAMCQPGGQLHPPSPPNCVVTCGEYPEGINGQYTVEPANFTVGTNLSFKCYGGFSTSDALVVKCQPNGEWSASGPRCEDIDECSDGSHNCTQDNEVCDNTMGSFVCECASGYSRSANGGCVDDVVLECGPDSLKVIINFARMAGVAASSIALMGDQSCRAVQSSDTLVIQSKLDDCGTSLSVTEEYVEYMNIVIDADDANISPPDKILIPVTCRYSKLENVNPRSFVNDFKVVKPLSRTEAAKFDFLVYQDEQFVLPLLKERPLLDFTNPIYLEIKAEYVGDVRAGAQQCWATDKDGQNRVQLITENCPMNETLVTIDDTGNLDTFQFTVSQALSKESGVTEGLIHCDAVACDPNNNDSICSSTCSSSKRRKRSLSGFLHATRLSVV